MTMLFHHVTSNPKIHYYCNLLLSLHVIDLLHLSDSHLIGAKYPLMPTICLESSLLEGNEGNNLLFFFKLKTLKNIFKNESSMIEALYYTIIIHVFLSI